MKSPTNGGGTYVLIRQSANDGQYSVDVCLTMEQFAGLMAVLRGLEMYFMDIELKKSSNLLDTMLMDGPTTYNPEHPWLNATSTAGMRKV